MRLLTIVQAIVVGAVLAGTVQAVNLGLEGTYLAASAELDQRAGAGTGGGTMQPPYTDDSELNFAGSIAPDWYVAYPSWIGPAAVHWRLSKEPADKTEGECSMKIMIDDEQMNPRDIYVGTKFPTVAGVEYNVFFDMKLGNMNGLTTKPFRAQYAVRADGSLSANDMKAIEDGPGSITFPAANFGDGLWHTYQYTFTATGPEASLIIYTRAREGAQVQGNFHLLDNLVVVPEPTLSALLMAGGLPALLRRRR
ncbi:MAG TPA: hypothetical protein PLL20_19580 [Phycisphaerae bacterium]|nr:hypothetical protein [Phycisphaerae bacterium]HRR86281.1 hypothetical protein [Phycisphaerae bacterium]